MQRIKYINAAIRCIIGIVFVYASIDKIIDPAGFATILYGYSVFPLALINIIAIIFPFIELVAGLCLIFKIFPESALIIINFFISVFIIIIGFNLLRGHEFNCGCFSVGDSGSASSAGQLLFRDLILLAAGLYLFFNRSSFPYNSES